MKWEPFRLKGQAGGGHWSLVLGGQDAQSQRELDVGVGAPGCSPSGGQRPAGPGGVLARVPAIVSKQDEAGVCCPALSGRGRAEKVGRAPSLAGALRPFALQTGTLGTCCSQAALPTWSSLALPFLRLCFGWAMPASQTCWCLGPSWGVSPSLPAAIHTCPEAHVGTRVRTHTCTHVCSLQRRGAKFSPGKRN